MFPFLIIRISLFVFGLVSVSNHQPNGYFKRSSEKLKSNLYVLYFRRSVCSLWVAIGSVYFPELIDERAIRQRMKETFSKIPWKDIIEDEERNEWLNAGL